MKKLSLALLALFTWVFTGCGGGSSATNTADTSVTGVFIDAKVKGLDYTCSSGAQGTTDVNGEYTCNIGDNVTFFIGSVKIGTIAAQTEIITPYSLFPNDFTAAVNLARLLQSLDTDGDETNDLIDLDVTFAALLPLDTDFTDPSFERDVEQAMGITLPGVEDARQIMNEAIVAAGGTAPVGTHAPVANAGNDQSIKTGATVTLDGSLSADADLDTLSYKWTVIYMPEESTATLSNAETVKLTFTADRDGVYVFGLVVNDGTYDSATDTVIVVARTDNSAPVAHAGDDQSIKKGEIVTLDGNRSTDADDDTLTHVWSMIYKPEESIATLSDAKSMNPTFTADVIGAYVFELVVNDGLVDSQVDTVVKRLDSYHRSSLGVVTSNLTGLQWQDDDVPVQKSWQSALDYCSNLSLDGGDWMLPDIDQLKGLVTKVYGIPPVINSVFIHTASSYYWSSSIFPVPEYESAQYVNFNDGTSNIGSYFGIFYVRCVRAGQ